MNMVRLITQFNGQEAPSGVYNPANHTFTKKNKNPLAGRHPHKNDLGGFDKPIIEYLKSLDCKLIELVLQSGTYYISFDDFISKSYEIKWKDTRFQYPRLYCPASYWSNSREAAFNHGTN